jgi:hypothetical protein
MAMLLLTFGSSRGNRIFSPGELSFSHNSMGNNCTQCHGALKGRPAAWLAGGAGSISAHDNSESCLKCHNVGEAPLEPHSLARSQLQLLKQVSLKKNGPGRPPASLILASFISSPDHPGEKAIACATCHKEHGGKEANLKKLTNDQCQNCHATQFAGLAEGHPQFTRYPFSRRTRIIFDHESHLRTHFTEPAKARFAPGSCLDCHQTDPQGGNMIVKPFEAVCASCHDDEIKGKSAVNTGVAFISIPQMDDRVLTGGYAIGEWPQDANEKTINPFVRLLLSSDPPLREAVSNLDGADLSNLPKTDAVKLKAAQLIAWGIKSLIFDLETGGQAELLKRISVSAGHVLTDHEKEGLVAFLSADTVRATFQTTFTNLQNEVLDYRNNLKFAVTIDSSPPPPAAGTVKLAASDAWVSQGGWYSPDGSFTLFYHPSGHADRFLTSWMNLTVDAGRTGDASDSGALFRELSKLTAAGLCSKCHSIDDTPAKQVNWMTFQPDPVEHGFNRFSHLAHLSLLDATGCMKCHPMNEPASQTKDAYASAFEAGRRDPALFHSNFQEIDKSTCAGCHQPNHVRDDCLLCHNYHVGRFKPVVANARINAAPPPRGHL